MPVQASRPTITATPQIVAAGRGADNVTVMLRGATATIYIGGSTVDATNGMPVAVGDAIVLDLYQGDVLYAVTATTASVNLLTTRS